MRWSDGWRERAESLCRPAVFSPLLFVLAVAVSIPFVDRGMIPNDEGALLTNAAKILRGEVFYRQIDAYPFPGAPYFLAFWMWLFGEQLAVARWLAVGVFCCVVLSLYRVGLRLLDPKRAALFGLSLLSLKLLAWPAFSAYTYSDLSFAFACLAIALVVGHSYRGPSLRLVLAGVCVGLSVLSKQSLGLGIAAATTALLAVPGAPLRERGLGSRSSEIAAFLAGAALSIAPALSYFAAQGVLAHAAHSGLVRPFTGYLPTSAISFLKPLAWWDLGELRDMSGFPYFVGPYWALLTRGALPGESWYPLYWTAGEILTRALYTSVPVVFLIALARWRHWTRRGSSDARELLALSALALAALLSAFPRADFFHVVSVYAPVWLLLFGLLQRPEPRARAWRLQVCAVALLLVTAGTLASVYHAHLSHRLRLARADLYVSPAYSWVGPVLDFVADQVAPDEHIFVYGHEAYYYFLSGRYYPWPFCQLYPGQAGGDDGRGLTELLEREPPRLVIRGILNWPALPSIPRYAPRLHAHLAAHFAPDGRLRERLGRDNPPPGFLAVLRPREAPPPSPR